MMVMGNDRHVVIVGGGISGLATALALRQRGIRSTVLEQRQKRSTTGLAINLPGNAVAALKRLGLGEAIERRGTAIGRREYRAARGRLLLSIDEDAFWPAAAQSGAIRRGDLIRSLQERLPCDTILHQRVVRLLDQEGERVRAVGEDDTVFEGDLVVGADGVGSAVRRYVTGAHETEPSSLGEASWRFMAPNPGVDCWTLWSGADALFLLLPVGTEVYGWATLRHDPGIFDPALLRAAAKPFPQPVRDAVDAALGAIATVHHGRLNEVHMPRWHAGRTLVVGDAAHATAPIWAQGAAMGLEDAIVLAETLSAVPDWHVALRMYEARRRPRVAHVQAATSRMARVAMLPSWLRNAMIPFVGRRSFDSAYEPLRLPA